MIRFQDGPAAEVLLMLRRAPLYLRVVRSAVKGEWDALDQLADAPAPRETIVAYRRVEHGHATHIRYARRGASGWYANAVYAVVAEQPDDATMRDPAKWRAWCYEQQKRDKERPA